MGRVEGRTAVVTGAASGIGASYAQLLAREGASVLLTDTDPDSGNKLANEIGGAARFLCADVTSEADWLTIAQVIEDSGGVLDILVNNAGVSVSEPIETTTRAQWDRVMAINVTGAFLGIRAMLPLLRRSNSASVINVSSTAGLRGYASAAAYIASKFAVRGLTKAAAVELAADGIRVNSVHPGLTRTAMADGVDPDRSHIPMTRLGEADEIARLVLFLASNESSFSTGAEFIADGGEIAGNRPR